MNATTLSQLTEKQLHGYNGAAAKNKYDYHRLAQKKLRELAHELMLAKTDYDLRSNKGGIAVCGEITLHTDTFYCQVSQSAMGIGSEVLFRSCKGRKDYSGGPNNFAPAAVLDDPRAFAKYLRECGRFGFELR